MSKFFSFVLALSVIVACTQPVSETKAVVERTVISEEPYDFRLESLEESAFGGQIVYSAKRRLTRAGASRDDFDDYTDVVITFPALSAAQFDFLIAHYSSNQSKVRYVEGQVYQLTDFLSPPIQALANQQLISLPGEESTNCWSTAYEVSNYKDDQISMYVTSPIEMMATLQDSRYATQLPEGTALEPGDMILDYWTEDAFISPNIGHAVIFIDKGIYFEKSGIGNTPFGIAAEGYPQAQVSVSNGREAFRFKKGAPPLGAEHFLSVGNDFRPVAGTSIPTTNYQIVYDSLGRAQIAQESSIPQNSFFDSNKAAYLLQFVQPPRNPDAQAEFETLRVEKPKCLTNLYSHVLAMIKVFKVMESTQLDCAIDGYFRDNNNYQATGSCVGHYGTPITDASMEKVQAYYQNNQRFVPVRSADDAFNFTFDSKCNW